MIPRGRPKKALTSVKVGVSLSPRETKLIEDFQVFLAAEAASKNIDLNRSAIIGMCIKDAMSRYKTLSRKEQAKQRKTLVTYAKYRD